MRYIITHLSTDARAHRIEVTCCDDNGNPCLDEQGFPIRKQAAWGVTTTDAKGKVLPVSIEQCLAEFKLLLEAEHAAPPAPDAKRIGTEL